MAWLIVASSTACDVTKTVDDIIDDVHGARLAIERESADWREIVEDLPSKLGQLEDKMAADSKDILADTKNKAQELANQTIQLAEATVSGLISQAGVELRCNAEFVRMGAAAVLQAIVEDLQFWKDKKKREKKPIHQVCWIKPSNLVVYPVGNGWAIDTANMANARVVQVFGYNFWHDALPSLELQNASGKPIRDLGPKALYVTHYQLSLDFSTEEFIDLQQGHRVVLRWPDQHDPNTITIAQRRPGLLQLSDARFTPASPTAGKDLVKLEITVTNAGGARSGDSSIVWVPNAVANAESPDRKEYPISLPPIEPGASRHVSFPGHVYEAGGIATSTVHLKNGDDTQPYKLPVTPAPPTPAPAILTSPCRPPITTIDLPIPSASNELPLSEDSLRIDFRANPPDEAGVIRLVLQTALEVTYWKGLELQNERSDILANVETEDRHRGPVTAVYAVREGEQLRLVLLKGKLFNIHTSMYCAGDVKALVGFTATFTWLRD
jgi:hypothetical protein